MKYPTPEVGGLARRAAAQVAVVLVALIAASPWAPVEAAGAVNLKPTGARLILLGTGGGPIARKFSSQPANLLTVDGSDYLIDAGDGVLRQLAWADTSVTSLKAVFLTHHHLDHTAGLGSVIAFRWIAAMAGAAMPQLQILGPPGTTELSQAALRYFAVSEGIFRTEAPTAPAMATLIASHDVSEGLIYRDNNIAVTAVQNSHYSTVAMPATPHGFDRSYSLRFDTKYGSIVFTGDTGPSEALARLAEGSDILVSEVMNVPAMTAYLRARANLPDATLKNLIAHMEREHMPPEQLGILASGAHVKRVILTHYGTPGEVGKNSSFYLTGIRKNYGGVIVVGHDLSQLKLTQVCRPAHGRCS